MGRKYPYLNHWQLFWGHGCSCAEKLSLLHFTSSRRCIEQSRSAVNSPNIYILRACFLAVYAIISLWFCTISHWFNLKSCSHSLFSFLCLTGCHRRAGEPTASVSNHIWAGEKSCSTFYLAFYFHPRDGLILSLTYQTAIIVKWLFVRKRFSLGWCWWTFSPLGQHKLMRIKNGCASE